MQTITVRIKRLSATVPGPTRMTEHSAGMDLSAAVAEPVVMRPGDILVVPCGFAMAIPPGHEGQVRPRSGLSSRHGVTMEPGMRIAQLLVLPVPAVTVVEVDDLDQTARGSGGFGHTGLAGVLPSL